MTPWLVLLCALLSFSGPVGAQTRDDQFEVCVRVSSWAACDPVGGYIAGPGGPCGATDLECIRGEWRRIGAPNASLPMLGSWCGRSHEDGGTLVRCDASPHNPGDPAPPPPPPSRDEALAACPVPANPEIFRDPGPEGLTGLETYLWASTQPALTAHTTIRGYAVTCTATPVSWRWETGDGATATRARPGGPPPGHAVTHTYQTRGDYQQRLAVTWRLDTPYGQATLTRETTRPYHVIEVRGAITR